MSGSGGRNSGRRAGSRFKLGDLGLSEARSQVMWPTDSSALGLKTGRRPRKVTARTAHVEGLGATALCLCCDEAARDGVLAADGEELWVAPSSFHCNPPIFSLPSIIHGERD